MKVRGHPVEGRGPHAVHAVSRGLGRGRGEEVGRLRWDQQPWKLAARARGCYLVSLPLNARTEEWF